MNRIRGAAFATGAFATLLAGGGALGASWDERVFPPGSHLDFNAIAVAGPSALPALIERGRELFKAKFTTADGAGRPKATQAIIPTRVKHGVNPPFSRTSGPDSNPVSAATTIRSSAARATTSPMCSCRRGSKARSSTRPTPRSRASGTRSRSWALAWSNSWRANGIVDLDAIDGVDADLVVRPFSRKGVFASLRQFTINALNVHHGMEAVERFGVRWTGSHDFDESGVPDAITAGDVSALVAFQATLAPPTVKADLPDDWRDAAKDGARTFKEIGCDSCHMETLPLKSLVFTDPAPYDTAGTLRSGEVKQPIRIDLGALPFAETLKKNDKGEWLIPLYSDLKRHLIVDETVNALGNELQAQRFVERDVFLTPRLWGVGSTAPYGHSGAFRMLDEIIAAHGGHARFARDAYMALDPRKRDDVIAFLRSLVIEAE
jgi:hypothetical protein